MIGLRGSMVYSPMTAGRWVTADFHIHSTYSGGSLRPVEIIKMARAQFLDAVAISDHNDICGAEEGRMLAATDNKMPQVLISQEISLGNHFHFLIIAGDQEHWEDTNRNQFLEKFAAHHYRGGAIILAHPWTMPKSDWARGFLEEIIANQLLDAVELFNGSILELSAENCSLMRKFWEEWVAPNKLAVVGGSDFHYYRQGRYPGLGRTYLKVLRPGENGIIEALHNRRCVAGLFSHRYFDLGWLGKGNGALFGAEPWFGELKQFVADLQNILQKSRLLKPGVKKHLSLLMEGGHYQMVQELLM